MKKSRIGLIIISIIILIGQLTILIVNSKTVSWTEDWGSLLSIGSVVLLVLTILSVERSERKNTKQ